MEQCVNSRGSKLTDRHTERHKLNITKCWVQGSGNVSVTARVFSVIARVFSVIARVFSVISRVFFSYCTDSAQHSNWVQ